MSTAARCELAANIDAPVVARYCQAWSSWKRAEEFLHAHGETSTGRSLVSGRPVVMQWPQAAHALRPAHTPNQDTTFKAEGGGTAGVHDGPSD
ncbi:MAG: P27 family phage terminase small subunit [Phycisphaerales bacterium]|nr:P27 family phage terminase small subunit [Phycisphaerales bacterium]